jgi:hypothetical protein
MSMRHQMRFHVRTLVGLAAAYAVALQAILLGLGGGPLAGAGPFAGLPICSSLISGLGSGSGAGHSVPAGHGDCCLGACPGCSCGTPGCPAPGPALSYAPAPLRTVAAAFVPLRLVPVAVTGGHRSRAPPLPA